MRIDLHTHSTASDGTDSPAELVAAAALAGLDVIAITDHDSTAGWAEAIAARPRRHRDPGRVGPTAGGAAHSGRGDGRQPGRGRLPDHLEPRSGARGWRL